MSLSWPNDRFMDDRYLDDDIYDWSDDAVDYDDPDVQWDYATDGSSSMSFTAGWQREHMKLLV